MFIKDTKTCEEFIAGDNAVLREFLHPDKDKLNLRYSLAHAIVKPGETSYRHKLKHAEVYYILEGEGMVQYRGFKTSGRVICNFLVTTG